MKKSDLIWAICDLDDDLLADTPQKPHRVPSPRALLLAAALVLALCGTALAAYTAGGWDAIFAKALSISEDSSLSAEASRSDVYMTVTKNGYTYTVKQILGSDHEILVALDITLPQDVAVPEVSISDIRAIAEENGYDWSSVEYILQDYYTEGATTLYPIDVSQSIFMPVHVDEEALFPEGSTPGYTDVSGTLYQAAAAAFAADLGTGVGASFGNGCRYNSYDPETKTLSVILFTHSDNNLAGSDCTLVLWDLGIADLEATYSQPESDDFSWVSENLISEPVVLYFTADYTPQSLEYTVCQEDQQVGTMTLSPFSAFLSFPQPEDDPTRLAPNTIDYLKGTEYETLIVTLVDGREVDLKMQGSSITSTQCADYYADQLFSLEDVVSVQLGDYTIIPQS